MGHFQPASENLSSDYRLLTMEQKDQLHMLVETQVDPKVIRSIMVKKYNVIVSSK